MRDRIKRLLHDLFGKHDWYYIESELPGSESDPFYSQHYECDICGDEYIKRNPSYFWREIRKGKND